jgi:hypothetical protein
MQGRASAAMWVWAGVAPKKAAWIGGISSTVYLTVIELLDAHSAKWGWSWGDMAANVLGSALFVSQQVGWEEQRIQLKFSFHRKEYSDSVLNKRSDDLFGTSWVERMLKDYNGQTIGSALISELFFPAQIYRHGLMLRLVMAQMECLAVTIMSGSMKKRVCRLTGQI